jgi:cathepsin A (carboxypeptidase C)
MQPFHRLVPGILEEIPVLIYAGKSSRIIFNDPKLIVHSGDKDFICNWLGNQAWTEALEWPGQKSFNKAGIKDLKLESGDKTGKVKSSGNLTFMQIFE